jgi:aminoglycoside phosphotransferase (APT) family kinase protein
MDSRRSSLTRVLGAAHEIAIAATHIPSIFTRTRIKDGPAHTLAVGDVEAVLDDARASGAVPPSWVISDVVPTVSDVIVVQVGEPQHPFSAYLKIARSKAAAASLSAQSRTLAELHSASSLGDWRGMLPRILASGMVDESAYILESAVSGSPLTGLTRSRVWRPALRGAVAAVRRLHEIDGEMRVVDEELLGDWVDSALETVLRLSTSWPAERHVEAVELLRRRLQRGLLGRTVWVCRTHGDFSPNNVLADVSSGRITGVIDWDRSLPDQPAFLDIGQFAIGAEHAVTRNHLGGVVRQICEHGAGRSRELALLKEFWQDTEGDRIDDSVVALMTLLRHVESNVDKAPRYASHRLWIYRTVESVLSDLAE